MKRRREKKATEGGERVWAAASKHITFQTL